MEAFNNYRLSGSAFNVQGSGFRVQGSGFRVQGSGFRVQGSGLKKTKQLVSKSATTSRAGGMRMAPGRGWGHLCW
jgi:hypothetical protein